MTTAVTEPQETRNEQLEEAGRKFLGIMEGLDGLGLTFTDLLLAQDMVGYERVGSERNDMRDLQQPERTLLVRRSRAFYRREPLVSRAINLWTEMCFGRPWSFQASDTAFQDIIDEVFGAQHNRRVFSRGGQQRGSRNLLIDGERPHVFFAGQNRVSVRTIDPLEIVEVLSNPEDKDDVWYYVRRWADDANKVHVWVYRDWNFVDEGGAPRNDEHPRLTTQRLGVSAQGFDVNLAPRPDEWMTIPAINDTGLRGYPLFAAGLDWVREHREFLKNRSSLIAARAQYAWKGTVKGGQNHVNRLADTLEGPSPLTADDGLRTSRSAAFVRNEGTDLEAMATPADGASARNDERALRLMALIPSGIPEHLIGDVSTGNLATAEALREPLEDMFVSYQGVWMDFYEEACEHIAQWRGFTGDTTIDIDAPSIFQRSLIELAQVVASVVTAYPAVRQSTEVLSLILTEMGLNNVEEVINLLEPYMDDEPDEEQVEQALEALRETARAHRERLAS